MEHVVKAFLTAAKKGEKLGVASSNTGITPCMTSSKLFFKGLSVLSPCKALYP